MGSVSRMAILIALLSGLLFGLGLIAGGMTDPTKIQAFLDIAGHWDPSLALVMGSAVGVAYLPFAYARRHSTSWLGLPLPRPAFHDIDRRLLFGSAIFGIGWGLTGFCPGPALVSVGAAYLPGIAFTIAMLWGMEGYERVWPG